MNPTPLLQLPIEFWPPCSIECWFDLFCSIAYFVVHCFHPKNPNSTVIAVDAAAKLRELGSILKDKVVEYVAARATQEGETDQSESRRRGLWAINCMQVGLILLGIAAVTVLVKL